MQTQLSQENYVLKMLKRFNMTETRPVTTPLACHFRLSFNQCPNSEEEDEISQVLYASAVGSLMHAMVCTRSDSAYAVSTVSRFMSNPGRQHWKAVKWVLRYLRGIVRLGLAFQRLKRGSLGYYKAMLMQIMQQILMSEDLQRFMYHSS